MLAQTNMLQQQYVILMEVGDMCEDAKVDAKVNKKNLLFQSNYKSVAKRTPMLPQK